MFASCAAWFYKYLGGIQPGVGATGFDKILISPKVPPQLTSAQVEMTAMPGKIISSWRKINSGLEMDVTIPFNTFATIKIPFGIVNSSDHTLYESGIVVDKSSKIEGLIQLSIFDSYYELEIGSGSYHFLLGGV